MYSLIYRSLAVEDLSSGDIRYINQRSVLFNKEHGITGCLLHHKGRFVQLLEGSKSNVLNLFEKIEKDKQHHSVQVLHAHKSILRMFHNWNMIYDDIHEESLEKMKYFEQIYHASDAVSSPCISKLELWKEVSKILEEERNSDKIL